MLYTNASLVYKYAQALLATSGKTVTYQQVKNIQKAADSLHANRQALYYVVSGSDTTRLLQETLSEFLKQFEIGIQIERLISLLVQNKRLLLLPAVLEAFVVLYKKKYSICLCVVTSAYELTTDEKKQLKALAESLFCKQAEMQFVIDKRLIAGIKIESNNRVWEHTVAKELRTARNALKEVCGGI